MVSFSCEVCGDVLTKKKLDQHRNRCRGATFTCIDCMVHFYGTEYRAHTSCVTEDQKYQGKLYKPKKTVRMASDVKGEKPEAPPALQPYVEDADDDYESWNEYEGPTDDERSPAEPPPEAPTPPSAVPDDDNVNVFDYLVATGQTPGATPNPSKLNLPDGALLEEASTSLVPYEYRADDYLEPSVMDFDDEDELLVEYGTGPVPGSFATPASKERRRKDGSVEKKDKKRKRLHVEVPRDRHMADAHTPGFHSGLTGGMDKLMKGMPPSPDYSGNDATPASPLKKTKHSKHSKGGQISNSIFGMLSSKTKGTKVKTKKSSTKKPRKEDKSSKLIEYRPSSKDSADAPSNQMIVYKPRADVFLSFVDKGPESTRGCSMNKALKRFHRERKAAGTEMTKSKEEKELWRSLRLRRNEAGDIVLFSEDGELDLDALVG